MAQGISEFAKFIKLILTEIKDGNEDNLREYLSHINFTYLPEEYENKLLGWFINQCSVWKRREICQVIVEYWQTINEEEMRLHTLTRIFMNNHITREALQFIVEVFPNQPYEFYMMELIEYDSSPEVIDAANKIEDVFGRQSYGIYNFLYKLTVDQENEEGYPNIHMQEYLELKMKETSEYVEKPSWIKDFGIRGDGENPDELPEARKLKPDKPLPPIFGIPSDTEVVEKLTEGFRNIELGILEVDDEEIKEIKSYFATQLAISTREEKIKLIRPYYEANAIHDLEEDVQIYKMYGPANPLYNVDFTDDNICTRYGGCRMLTCVEFENYDEDYDIIDENINEHLDAGMQTVDWFKGACDVCYKKIRYKHYAVRKPLAHGGWIGCHCSWECVRNSLREPDILTLAMIGRIQNQMEEIGIQDRVYSK